MFAIPTLGDLVERGRRAFRTYLPGSDAWLWPNNIGPTAKVLAGMIHEVFGFADYISKQKFALTADSEHLDKHGEELGMARRPAEPARGIVRLEATDEIIVAAGALFRRSDGVEYRATLDAVLPGSGALDVSVVATTDGKATSALAGTPLQIVDGVSGDALATVQGGILGGRDVEDDEAFRARILFRKRNPPHGGSAADYVLWTSEESGVSRVFVERLWMGAGSVRVFPLMDDLFPDGIPDAAAVLRVRDHIEMVRPAGAVVTVAAPAPVPIDVVISGMEPDTSEVREAVKAELRAAFRRLSRVSGTDTAHGGMPYLATPATFSRSWIWQSVANAIGEERHIIEAPISDVALAPGAIATLGDVTFV